MDAPELLTWRGFEGGMRPRRLASTSGRALSVLAHELGHATVVTVPHGLDADIYVVLSVARAASPDVAARVARALQANAGSVTEALGIIDEVRGGHPLVVDGLDRLAPWTAGGDLVDLLEPRRRDVANWLEERATVSLVDPQRSDDRVPVGPANMSGWDTSKLWQLVGEDAERFALAVAVRTWLGQDAFDEHRLDAASLVLDLWQALPADVRDLLGLLVVHGRPAPRSLLASAQLLSDEVVGPAVLGWLVDEVGGELRLSPAWYTHAPVPAAARAPLHRRLANGFAGVVSGGSSGDVPLAALEAHRHFIAVPDVRKAREFARFGAAYLLDHARQRSEAERFGEAADEYDAVLRLDDAAREAGSGAIGAHARAYAKHYCHFNRARQNAEEMKDTLAGYEEALVSWPENALFWSRVIRCKFLLGDWVGAKRALDDAYHRVPAHPKRDSVLIIRTAERLLERGEVLPAFIVATERQLSGALSLAQLWQRLEKGVAINRLWVPGGQEMRLASPHVLRLARGEDAYVATWLGTRASDAGAREAMRLLAQTMLRRAIRALESEQPGGEDRSVAMAIDTSWATRAEPDARWITALRRLDERVERGEMPASQRDAVIGAWRALSHRTEGLRRPAIGPTPDGSYFLSWAYDDIPQRVVTIEVANNGQCEWFTKDGRPGACGEGEGSVEEAVAALAPEMRAYAE